MWRTLTSATRKIAARTGTGILTSFQTGERDHVPAAVSAPIANRPTVNGNTARAAVRPLFRPGALARPVFTRRPRLQQPGPRLTGPTHARPTHARPTHARPTHARPTDARPTDPGPTHARPGLA